MAVTWPSPMLVKLNGTDDNPVGQPISKAENSLLASICILGAIIGSLSSGLVVGKFGRKTLLLLLGLPNVIFYLVMAWSKVVWLLIVSRVAIGLSLGGVFTILPMYCGEIADAHNRGILSASMTVFVNIGMLIPYCLGPYMPYFWFHIVLAIIPVLYMVTFFFSGLESPYYLINKDEQAAKNVLLKIRNKENVTQLLQEMKNNSEQTSDVSIMDILKSKGLRKAFIMGLGGMTFMQLTGTAIVATYSQTIFKQSGGSISPEVGPILVAVAQLIMTIFVSAISDRYPRRLLLTLSHLLVGLIQIPFGTYFFMKKHDYDVSSIGWMPLVCLMTFVCAYNIGVGPILMTLLGELFPPEVKGVAISFLVSYNWIVSFTLTASFKTLDDAIGVGVLFWIFAVCNLIAIIFVRLFMIETKGRTLEEIQTILNH